MTTSYSGNPASSNMNWVRFTLQDVAATWKFTDEEIQAILNERLNKYLAASDLAMALSSRYAEQVDYSNGALAEQASQRAAAWAKRAEELRDAAAQNGGAQMYIGGQDMQERIDRSEDEDLTQPDFGQGMLDNPEVVLPSGRTRFGGW